MPAKTPGPKTSAEPRKAPVAKKAVTAKAVPTKAAAPERVATPTKVAAAKKVAVPTKVAAAKKVTPSKKAAATKAVTKKAAAAKKPAAKKAAGPERTAASKAAAPKKTVAAKAAAATAAAAVLTGEMPASAEAPVTPVVSMATRKGPSKALIGVGVALVVALVGGGAALAMRDPAPSKEEYIAKADEICRPGNGPVTAIVKPTNYPELATASSTVVTATAGELKQLDELRRPGGGDGKTAETAVNALTSYRNAADALRAAAEKKDDAATIAATKSLQAAYADAKTKSETFGFAACGTGMQPGVDTTVAGATAVIKAGFIAKADTFCRSAATQLQNLPLTPDTDAGFVMDLNNSLKITQKLVADLKTLPPAPGDETVVSEMIVAADKLNVKIAELRDAVVAQDLARVQAVARETNPLGTDADHRFDSYGLGSCGSSFGD